MAVIEIKEVKKQKSDRRGRIELSAPSAGRFATLTRKGGAYAYRGKRFSKKTYAVVYAYTNNSSVRHLAQSAGLLKKQVESGDFSQLLRLKGNDPLDGVEVDAFFVYHNANGSPETFIDGSLDFSSQKLVGIYKATPAVERAISGLQSGSAPEVTE